MAVQEPSLWTCPKRGHQFVSRNLWHSCGNYEIDDRFKGRDALLRKTFDRLVDITSQHGPVTVYAQKTRIVFMVQARKDWLYFSLWLTRRVEHPLLIKTEVFGPNYFGLGFRLSRPNEIDPEQEALIAEAYRTGLREHLKSGNALRRNKLFSRSRNEREKPENRGAGVRPHPCFRVSSQLS